MLATIQWRYSEFSSVKCPSGVVMTSVQCGVGSDSDWGDSKVTFGQVVASLGLTMLPEKDNLLKCKSQK